MKAEPGKKGFFVKKIAPVIPFYGGKQHGLPAAVQGIAGDGTAKGRGVNPYLVGSARFRQRLQNAEIARAAKQPEKGKGSFPPVFVNNGTVLTVAVGDQRKIAGSFPPCRPAADNGNVPFGDIPPLKGQRKAAVGRLVLREYHQPRGVTVYAVDGKKFRLGETGGAASGFGHKAVQALPGIVPAVAAHGNAGGLADRDNVTVFVDDGKRGKRRYLIP